MKQQDYLLKKIDKIIFSKLDLFVQNSIYAKYTDLIKPLGQDAKNFVNKIILIATTFFPFVIVSIFYFSNSTYKDKIDLKRQINVLSTKIIHYRTSTNKKTNNLLNAVPLKRKSQLEAIVRDAATKLGLDTNDFKIANFSSSPQNSFTEAKANIKFSKVSTPNLINFLYDLTISKKIKIISISIDRDARKKLLFGNMEVAHYASNTSTIQQ